MTSQSYPTARVRLLWDEQLSPRVPRALRELGFATSHVGHDDDGAPARGSSDRDVLDYARQTTQVIVTSNHDMMLICAEAGQRFVWLDPRGRQYSRAEQVLVVFTQIDRWELLLNAGAASCVRAMRTKCDAIDAAEAARLARRRMRDLRRRQRTRPKQAGQIGTLLTDGSGGSRQ